MGLPATWSSTLGWVWVWGRSRVPTPATGMMAMTSPGMGPSRGRQALLELVDARDRRRIHAVQERQVQAHVVSELDQRREPRDAALAAPRDLVHRGALAPRELGGEHQARVGVG